MSALEEIGYSAYPVGWGSRARAPADCTRVLFQAAILERPCRIAQPI